VSPKNTKSQKSSGNYFEDDDNILEQKENSIERFNEREKSLIEGEQSSEISSRQDQEMNMVDTSSKEKPIEKLSPGKLVSVIDNSAKKSNNLFFNNQNKKPKQKLDDYDLVLYKSVNSQRYIKSLSYYEFLLHSLKVGVMPMLRKQIFDVSRESGYNFNKEEYLYPEFTSIVYVQLEGTDICVDQEFEDLKEKHVQLENYYINRYAIEKRDTLAQTLYLNRFNRMCPICKQYFEKFEDFAKNYVNCLIYQMQKNRGDVMCSFCEKRFINKLALSQHILYIHFGVE
jgi:hypothetical protein